MKKECKISEKNIKNKIINLKKFEILTKIESIIQIHNI